MKRHIVSCAVMMLVFATAFGSNGLKASAKVTSKTIANGIKIGDIDVSGMTADQATEAISSYFDNLSNVNIDLVCNAAGDVVTIPASDLGIKWDNKNVVAQAYSLGKAGNVVQRYKEQKDLENEGYQFDLEYHVDDAMVEHILNDQCKAFDSEKEDCDLIKDGDHFNIVEGHAGKALDVDASKAAITSFIENNWNGQETSIELVTKIEEPLGSREQLALVKDVLGTFTTSYKSSGTARCANIANACSLIDGTVVYPGEEFSVLDKITPFSIDNGYFPAGSYLNGLVVESIGGGICQVSTTLYNAVLLSELEVTERHNHSMIVTYVDPSADAAIAESSGKDFKFKNNLEVPIYIEGKIGEKNITFTIYGCETRDAARQVAYNSEVIETIPASADDIRLDGGKPIGSVARQGAHIGYKARLWKTVTENGTQVSREQVNSSNYKMVPRIITLGTAGATPEQIAQIQTAIAEGNTDGAIGIASAIGAENAAAAAAVEQQQEQAPAEAPAEAVAE